MFALRTGVWTRSSETNERVGIGLQFPGTADVGHALGGFADEDNSGQGVAGGALVVQAPLWYAQHIHTSAVLSQPMPVAVVSTYRVLRTWHFTCGVSCPSHVPALQNGWWVTSWLQAICSLPS